MFVFSVPEMSCGHCVATIEAAVQALDTAARVEADLTSRSARIETSAEADVVRNALAGAGYEAELR